MCLFLLKGFWNLPWNAVSSWSKAGSGKRRKRMTRHPKLLLVLAPKGWPQTEHPIGALPHTSAVSWVGCGLTTFFEASGSFLQGTWLQASRQLTVRLTRAPIPCPTGAKALWLSQGPSVPHKQPSPCDLGHLTAGCPKNTSNTLRDSRHRTRTLHR